MPPVIRFTLARPTPSLNPSRVASKNWRAVASAKRRLQLGWGWEIKAQLPADLPNFPRAHVTIIRYSVGSLDPDNLKGGVKGLVDVLKVMDPRRNPRGLGIIGGDEADKLHLDVRQVKCKRAEERTEIEIREWDDE